MAALLRLPRYVALAIAMYALLYLLPYPSGAWYFGHRPQWFVVIDSAGLWIGTYENHWNLGIIPVVVGELAAVTLPLWLAWWYLKGRRRPC